MINRSCLSIYQPRQQGDRFLLMKKKILALPILPYPKPEKDRAKFHDSIQARR